MLLCNLQQPIFKTDTQMDTAEKANTKTESREISGMKAAVRDLKIFFQEADVHGRGIDMKKFQEAMQILYPTSTEEELKALYMQIDTNCNGTVDFKEVLEFCISRSKARKKMAVDRTIFSLVMKKIEVSYHNKIVQIIHRTGVGRRWDNIKDKEEYLSVGSDGDLNFWTESFQKRIVGFVDVTAEVHPYAHKPKVQVSDMVYIKEFEEVAIATRDEELGFYSWNASKVDIKYSLIREAGRVAALNYWSDGKKTVFSYGDLDGSLYVFISYNIEENGLFNDKRIESKIFERNTHVYVSALLKKPSKDYLAVKMPMFNGICSLIKYFPSLEEFGVCSQSSTNLVLAALPKLAKETPPKKVFKNPTDDEIFTCVEYCSETNEIVTGGFDGILRIWSPQRSLFCKAEYGGQYKSITYLLHNPKEKVLICIHKDQVISIWSLERRQCLQNFKVEGMGDSRISSVCHSIRDNMLVLANTNIGLYRGRGTDLFKEMLSSHPKPVCGAMYHNIYKQVVSVCQKGLVTVWDENSGKSLMQFNVSPYKLGAITAMAFDQPQRKLVTVCNDGKVRFWNFNNGKELEVLPVTVPTLVTGIICTKQRVFVSGKHSNILYNLDLNGQKPIYMKHPLIKDGISSIALHPSEGKLHTASENGCIVVWGVASCEAIYAINIQESPKIQHISKGEYQGTTGDLPVEKKVHMVNDYERIPVPNNLLKTKIKIIAQNKVFNSPLILCLKSRLAKSDRATLLIAEGCYISAWSVTPKGGLLAKFKATKDNARITTMNTDASESMLMLGDSKGCVYVWNIQTYGDGKQEFKEPFEEINQWKVSVCPPLLLKSWKAHNSPVMSFTSNSSCENFITSGWDCNVHMWTNKQHCVGTFGREQWKKDQLSPHWKPVETAEEVNQDIKPSTPKATGFWPVQKTIIPKKPPKYSTTLYEIDRRIKDLSVKTIDESNRPSLPKESAQVKEKPVYGVRHFLEKKQFQEFALLDAITCPDSGAFINDKDLSVKMIDKSNSPSLPKESAQVKDKPVYGVRHFFEKKQFQEFALLDTITCPHSGPFINEHQIDLTASPTMHQKECSPASQATYTKHKTKRLKEPSQPTSENKTLSPSKEEAKHINTPSHLMPSDEKGYSAARQTLYKNKYRTRLKEVLEETEQNFLSSTKAETELPEMCTQSATASVEKKYPLETQMKFRELYIGWKNESSQIKCNSNTLLEDGAILEDNETPAHADSKTPITPALPAHKEVYSLRYLDRVIQGRQQKKTSEPTFEGSSLPSVLNLENLEKLTVNRTARPRNKRMLHQEKESHPASKKRPLPLAEDRRTHADSKSSITAAQPAHKEVYSLRYQDRFRVIYGKQQKKTPEPTFKGHPLPSVSNLVKLTAIGTALQSHDRMLHQEKESHSASRKDPLPLAEDRSAHATSKTPITPAPPAHKEVYALRYQDRVIHGKQQKTSEPTFEGSSLPSVLNSPKLTWTARPRNKKMLHQEKESHPASMKNHLPLAEDMSALADNKILFTPTPPAYKEGYSLRNQASLRIRHGKQQKKTSEANPVKSQLPFVLERLIVKGTRNTLAPPNAKKPEKQARFEPVLSRRRAKDSKFIPPTKTEVTYSTITLLPKVGPIGHLGPSMDKV